mmetsp:Transcript_34445/g.39839  ORF Transcript_34445/g.39839 Transcript_34445/m.39839 type:complete len:93 (+) Transcript_34445:192-470(+)
MAIYVFMVGSQRLEKISISMPDKQYIVPFLDMAREKPNLRIIQVYTKSSFKGDKEFIAEVLTRIRTNFSKRISVMYSYTGYMESLSTLKAIF